MNISGKDLKELIPDDVVFSVDSVQLLEREQALVLLHLGHRHSGLSMLVYRKSMGKVLMKAIEAPVGKSEKPKAPPVETTTAAATEEEGHRIGMTRRKDGVTQTLTGFTASGSMRERPPQATRRVTNPTTGQLVWPLWSDKG